MDHKFSYSTFGCGSTCHLDVISYIKHFRTAPMQEVSCIYVSFAMKFAAWIESKLCWIPITCEVVCAKTCLFKPPKICFQSDVWWGNGKYFRLLFSFTLSPLQLCRIHVPRWHKMYDAPFFSVKSPTSVTLQWLYRAPCHLLRALLSKIICDGTPVMTTTAQAEDIGEHLIMGLNWEFISMFISEPKSGASLFSSLLLQLDQSLITEIPELTSVPITSGVTDIIREHFTSSWCSYMIRGCFLWKLWKVGLAVKYHKRFCFQPALDQTITTHSSAYHTYLPAVFHFIVKPWNLMFLLCVSLKASGTSCELSSSIVTLHAGDNSHPDEDGIYQRIMAQHSRLDQAL